MPTELLHLISALPERAVTGASHLGLAVASDLDGQGWLELIGRLAQLTQTTYGSRQTLTAWLGDVLAHERAPQRGQITQCASIAGLDPGTLRNAKLVCRRIPMSRRHDALSWSHHCEIALAFSAPDEIEKWLDLAEKEALPTAELRQRIRHHLAESRSDARSGVSSMPFRLMRDLRTAARTAEQLRGVWRQWPASTAELALAEIESLAGFIDAIRKRSGAHRAPSGNRTFGPCEPGVN
jgi:hypothetical protein